MTPIPDIDAVYYFVKSVDGDYAVQVTHEDGSFVILTDDLAFPGGIGWADEWTTVSEDEVPEELRRELLYAVDGYVDYVLMHD
jgi:uncharacterized circularly permuted ATP-grasp superfamily protein